MIEILGFQSTKGRVTQLMLRADALSNEEVDPPLWQEEDGGDLPHGRGVTLTVGATSIAYGEELPFALSMAVEHFTWCDDSGGWCDDPTVSGSDSSESSSL